MRYLGLIIGLFILGNVTVYGQDAQTFYDDAEALFDAGEYKKAVKQCQKAIDADAEFQQAYVLQGECYYQMKEFDNEFSTYNAGLRVLQKSSTLYQSRGMKFQNAGMFEEALRDYNLAVKFAENDSAKYSFINSRSTAKLNMRNFQGAYEDLMACYKFDSTNFAVLLNLGAICDEVGKDDEVVYFLEKADLVDETGFAAKANLAFFYQRKEMYDKSAAIFEKILAEKPDEAYTLNNQSYNYLKMGKLKEALALVDKSIKLMPYNSYAYKNRALIYIEMDKTKKACEDLARAVELGFTEQYGSEVNKLQAKYCK